MDAREEGHRRRPRYGGTHPRRFDQRYKERDPAKYPGIIETVRARGMTPAGTHVPVLLPEVIGLLRPSPGEAVLDCTVGFGGHAAEFASRIAPGGLLVGLDADEAELEHARARLPETGCRVRLLHRNFETASSIASEEGIDGFDVVFADLGASSMQLDDPERGFSFKSDGPLDMRMDRRNRRTAADVLASMPKDRLAAALAEIADEEDAEAIAAAVARIAARRPITRTLDLVQIVARAKGPAKPCGPGIREIHPAARTFMALRILVNRELDALRRLLESAPSLLRKGGRIGIISFHSGEDRIVKAAFRSGLDEGAYSGISEEVVRPSREEIRSNPRSSAAKFRWAASPLLESDSAP